MGFFFLLLFFNISKASLLFISYLVVWAAKQQREKNVSRKPVHPTLFRYLFLDGNSVPKPGFKHITSSSDSCTRGIQEQMSMRACQVTPNKINTSLREKRAKSIYSQSFIYCMVVCLGSFLCIMSIAMMKYNMSPYLTHKLFICPFTLRRGGRAAFFPLSLCIWGTISVLCWHCGNAGCKQSHLSAYEEVEIPSVSGSVTKQFPIGAQGKKKRV